jgi:PKD repeat protein
MWPSGASGLWISTAPDVTFDNNASVSTEARHLPGGTSSLIWIITKDGCASSDTVTVVNNAIYPSAGPDQTVCQTNTTMNGSLDPGQTGNWTVDNGSVIITTPSSPTTNVTNLITGNNTFTWTVIGNGCSVYDNVTISSNGFTVSAGNNAIACGDSTRLRGSDPLTGSGLWTINSGNGTFANANNPETDVTGMVNGPNTFIWTVNRGGCQASANVTITNDLYEAVVGNNFAVCFGNTSVNAQAIPATSGGATGLWTAQTGGGVFTTPTSNTSNVSGLAVGINRLRWTVTKGTCVSYAQMEVTNNAPTATAGIDQTTCNDFASLSATALSPGGSGYWIGGGVMTLIENSTSPSTNVTNLQPGINTFSWTVTENGCTATTSVRIISNHFTPYAGGDQSLPNNFTTMTAILPDPAAIGTWSVLNGSGNITLVNNPASAVTNLGPGMNTFRWSVVWNTCSGYDDVNIIYNSITADAGPDTTICTSSYTMQANTPSPGAIGVWIPLSINPGLQIVSPNSPVTQITGIQSGSVNTLRWKVSLNGLEVFSDVTIINKEFYLSAGNRQDVCTNYATMAAEAPGAGTGSWRIITGAGMFVSSSFNNTLVTNLGEGVNRFEWTVSKTGGCIESDTVIIFYNLPPTAAFSLSDTAGCSPVSVSFTNLSTGVNVPQGGHYYWYFGDKSLNVTTPPDTVYTAQADGDSTYNIMLIAYDEANCSDTVTHTVTAYAIPQIWFTVTPLIQYWPQNDIIIQNRSGQNYANYAWNFGDGETALDLTYQGNHIHSYATWGSYEITLTVSSATCSSDTSQTIEIRAPAPNNLGGFRHTYGCAPYTQIFKAATEYATKFYWDFGDGGTSTLAEPIYIYDEPGVYIVQLYAGGPGTISDDGTDTALVFIRKDTVTVYPQPVADFIAIPDSVMLPNQPIHCYNRSSYSIKWEWDFGMGNQTISSEENPLFYYTEPGTYYITLRVWGEYNCYDDTTAVIGVVVEPAGVCKFPNAFSPNLNGPSDGRWDPNSREVTNDIFHPVYRGVLEYKLEIFNRWGEKIFESNNPNIGWDGYVDDKLAAQDVYVWKVTGKFKNGAPFKDAGDVTLLR